jgi:hypothetical protein
MNHFVTYWIKALPQEHRSVQSPEVDLSAFDDEVTFREPDPCSGSKLLKDTLELLLWQWWYFMEQKVLLWGSTGRPPV